MIENLLVGIEMLAVGMTGVFVVLSFFYGLMLMLIYIDEKNTNKKNAKVPVSKSIATKDSAEKSNDDSSYNELMAVISAAVASSVGKKLRIKSVTASHFGGGSNSWAVIGRQILLNSHKLK